MKLAILQFNPVWADSKRNRLRASHLLKRFNPGDLHFLLLPEMAFSGYVFNSKEEIEPYLEDETSGPTVTWAKKQAVRLKCYVQVGYPQKQTETGKCYNSACLISPTGELVQTYQKHFLYETDENWAEEGPGFLSKEISLTELEKNRNIKAGMGICMDVNPYRFLAPFQAFEFANYHRKHGTDLLLCSMAWLTNEETDENSGNGDHEIEKPKETPLDTANYWALRMLPLFEKEPVVQKEEKNEDGISDMHDEQSDRTGPVDGPKRVIFAASNRTGMERGSRFAGSSCVLLLNPGQRPQLLGILGREEEGVLVVEVDDVLET